MTVKGTGDDGSDENDNGDDANDVVVDDELFEEFVEEIDLPAVIPTITSSTAISTLIIPDTPDNPPTS